MKNRNVAIKLASDVIYEETLPGANKSKKPQYIRELMSKADVLLRPGTVCTLHYQQDGAKGWAQYEYTTGSSSCTVL